MNDAPAHHTVDTGENDKPPYPVDASLQTDAIVTANPWQALRQFTPARIALGRAGVSMPTAPQLAFQLAHAQARDAVHAPLDVDALLQDLASMSAGLTTSVMQLDSAAADRAMYLQRPDLGRRLSAASHQKLVAWMTDQVASGSLQAQETPAQPVSPSGTTSAVLGQDAHDIALVLADGLSPLAINRQAAPFLAAFEGVCTTERWRLAPLTIVRQARVAIGDEIGALLGARMVVVLIGERPGLSSPDSMGLYMTWMPRVGLTDERRNCISNVRPAGLDPAAAAGLLQRLLIQAFQRQLSGVALKDVAPAQVAGDDSKARFRLMPARLTR